ncbi:MAG TPA: Mur ligase family protein [Pyrinomonadaceae bacterium]
MNFAESLTYLLALGNEVLAMKLGLASTEKLLAALGNPQNNFLKIQIAGTNGKGSTCAFLEAICLRAGIKTGLMTSPHLISITERIRINGAEIGEKDFARHATRVREISEELVKKGELETVPTFFEQVTAIAISALAEAKIDLAILETGLGGRFDSVTATRAEIAAITQIDYDHQKILGNTLAEIAAEKAAIIREDTKVIMAEQKDEAAKVILEACEKFNVEPKISDFEFQIIERGKGAENGLYTVTFQTEKAEYKNVRLSLRGKHQIENARVAVLLAEALQDDFKISTADIVQGLRAAKHKGRLEFYKGILFDGAHNASGAKALGEYFDEFIEQPVTLIFGAMRDKDLSEIAEILFPRAAYLILTRADNPRSLETGELIKFLPFNFERRKVFQTQSVTEALKIAAEVAPDNLICVTGSLYLVGEAQKALSESVPER